MRLFMVQYGKIICTENNGVGVAKKAGTTTITVEANGEVLATREMVIKCNHDKTFISKQDATCTETGECLYQCDVCAAVVSEVIDKKPHNYVYGEAATDGTQKGICSDCQDTIQIVPTTSFNAWWRNSTSTSTSYYSITPESNPLNSEIYCWLTNVNGDTAYEGYGEST